LPPRAYFVVAIGLHAEQRGGTAKDAMSVKVGGKNHGDDAAARRRRESLMDAD
jgi:hypothetical protein